MKKILAGVRRFQSSVFPQRRELFQRLSHGQQPEALFITCADSRIDPSLITQSEPGELFICRNAGNIVPPHTGQTGGVTASIEYAVGALGVRHVIVCGHSYCGAMTAAMDPRKLERFPHVKNWLTHSLAAVRIVEEAQNLSEEKRLQALIEQNVLMQLTHLRTHPYVAAALAAGRLEIHGWVYRIESGQVLAYDEVERAFLPVGAEWSDETGETTPTSDLRNLPTI
ncbi:MAG: carbonic anhydrase [Acidobacteria bacterium]|nr:carbonic anhydrase [Acidobacteriota bacterium]